MAMRDMPAPGPLTHGTRREFIDDPHPYLTAQRDIDPVRWTRFFDDDAWFVTGYREADAILRDPRFLRQPPDFVSADGPLPRRVREGLELKRKMVLLRDPPRHTEIRRMTAKVFTTGMVAGLEPTIRTITSGLIDSLKGRCEHKLMGEFAYVLPVLVICEMLGIPKEERHACRRWSEAVIRFVDFAEPIERLEEEAGNLLEARDFFVELCRRRRRDPREDLITQLALAWDDGDGMSDDELAANCMFMLTAGHLTTMDAISSGFDLLMRHPEARAKLAADPTLVPGAVEEILRYEPPLYLTSRWLADDLDLGGRPLRRGQFVLVSVGAAHRDPRTFEDPHRFDITRKTRTLAFGSGPHFCVGAGLARLETAIALELLVRRLAGPRLIEAPRWRDNLATRGYCELKVAADIV